MFSIYFDDFFYICQPREWKHFRLCLFWCKHSMKENYCFFCVIKTLKTKTNTNLIIIVVVGRERSAEEVAKAWYGKWYTLSVQVKFRLQSSQLITIFQWHYSVSLTRKISDQIILLACCNNFYYIKKHPLWIQILGFWLTTLVLMEKYF